MPKITLQTLAARNFQLMRIKAEQVQDRGMHVGDVMRMLDGMEAEFICSAVDGAAFDAAAGHPDTEAIRMMIAAIAAL